MEYVTEYLAGVVCRTFWQLWQVFGMAFAIAYALQYVGSRIRGTGAGRFGRLYWYFVVPGVACHETGHAMGCLVTGTRLVKFVPFRPEGNRLGFISHEATKGILGGFASVVITTGPIWFGFVAIMLLTWLLAGDVSVARWGEFFSGSAVPEMLDYCKALLGAAISYYWTVLESVSIHGVGFWAWLYLTFCIASEIGLSRTDMKYMRRGLLYVFLLFLMINLVPVAGKAVSMGVFIIMPYLFRIHVLMLAALGMNIMLFILFRFLFVRVLGK